MKTAYKLFKIKSGKLYPLYILADKEIPMGEWIEAETGELLDNGKVKSKLGQLCFRPGFHLADIPYAAHIGQKDGEGNLLMKPDTVWCEVEYSDEVDYQPVANKNGTNKDGKVIPVKSYLKEIPVNGYYRYKTSPLMYEDWIIAGAIKVLKILTNEEIDRICWEHGIEPQKRVS